MAGMIGINTRINAPSNVTPVERSNSTSPAVIPVPPKRPSHLKSFRLQELPWG